MEPNKKRVPLLPENKIEILFYKIYTISQVNLNSIVSMKKVWLKRKENSSQSPC